jgi:hypothetical protein
MRPIRTIAPLTLGLVALAVAGCQSRPDQPTTPAPTPIERADPATTAPKPKPAPRPETIVGLWPARTLGYARTLQDRADADHQPWLLSPELVAASYGAAKAEMGDPVTRKVGRAAYDVGERNSEWAVTVYLAQPVRQGTGGIWVVTRTGSPEGSY